MEASLTNQLPMRSDETCFLPRLTGPPLEPPGNGGSRPYRYPLRYPTNIHHGHKLDRSMTWTRPCHDSISPESMLSGKKRGCTLDFRGGSHDPGPTTHRPDFPRKRGNHGNSRQVTKWKHNQIDMEFGMRVRMGEVG